VEVPLLSGERGVVGRERRQAQVVVVNILHVGVSLEDLRRLLQLPLPRRFGGLVLRLGEGQKLGIWRWKLLFDARIRFLDRLDDVLL